MPKERKTQKVWNSNQSWYYESLWKVKDQKAKVQIRRNAYDEQSSAKISLFDAHSNKWNVAATVPHPQMKCLHLNYTGDATEKDFLDDEKALLEELEMIL